MTMVETSFYRPVAMYMVVGGMLRLLGESIEDCILDVTSSE